MSNDFVPNPASLRAGAYSFLASIYLGAPAKKLITELLRKRPFSIESQGMKILNEFLSQNKLTSPELLEKLVTEHVRLFGGVSPGFGPLPPYESIWRGEGRVMSSVTTKVLQAYDEADVEPTTRLAEPPDHVGLELGFLSYLCNRENDARRNNDPKCAAKCMHMEYEFLRDHILEWVPIFCDQIAENDRTGFYRAIAILTKEFILADGEEILEQMRKYH